MSLKAEQKDRSREAIIKSAATLMRRRGIAGVSVADVMKGAGLTVGGFYGHFESKEALFAATIRETAFGLWAKLLEASKTASRRERALTALKHYLSRAHRDHPDEGCLLPSVAGELARSGDGGAEAPLRGALEAELRSFVKLLSELLGKDGGGRERAIGLLTLMYGALSLSRALNGTPLSDEVLRAAKKLGELVVADVPEGDAAADGEDETTTTNRRKT